LLESYLQKLFLILGGAAARKDGQIELCYVDCFAGPWGDETTDLRATSIAISLHTLDVVRQKLGRNGVSASIRALYIEKDANAFGKLQTYLRGNTPNGIQAEGWNDDFVAKRDGLLQWAGKDAFTFFFIDPMGPSGVEVGTLKPLLERPRSEFLINFMYDFINRMVSMPAMQADMTALLGESVNVNDMVPRDRERTLLKTYRTNLKKPVLRPRVRISLHAPLTYACWIAQRSGPNTTSSISPRIRLV
jgi:three-Cys-motif partner protein